MKNSEPHFVTATLWEPIMPLDRGERYEDPLGEALQSAKLGGTCGGGSQLSDEWGIEFVDIEIELRRVPRACPCRSGLDSEG